jgi:hypothetical protein
MDWVVAPLLQRLPVALDEVRVTDPPWQKLVGPLAVMVGVEPVPRVTLTAGAVAEQLPFVTTTE